VADKINIINDLLWPECKNRGGLIKKREDFVAAGTEIGYNIYAAALGSGSA
jgi:hypothetical protein